jgi:uncharacterized membrane protein
MRAYMNTMVQPSRFTSWTGFVAAVLGLVLASIILVEKLKLALNPDYVTSCSINPIVSCSPVMSSPQAAAFFDLPNPLIGLIGFSLVASLFFISFFVKLPRFLWVANSVGVLLALVFCFWLATQALFVIQAICLYCCGVWLVVSVLTFFSLKPVLMGTKAEDFIPFTKIGMVVTVFAFVFMVFFAFQQFWLSLLS